MIVILRSIPGSGITPSAFAAFAFEVLPIKNFYASNLTGSIRMPAAIGSLSPHRKFCAVLFWTLTPG